MMSATVKPVARKITTAPQFIDAAIAIYLDRDRTRTDARLARFNRMLRDAGPALLSAVNAHIDTIMGNDWMRFAGIYRIYQFVLRCAWGESIAEAAARGAFRYRLPATVAAQRDLYRRQRDGIRRAYDTQAMIDMEKEVIRRNGWNRAKMTPAQWIATVTNGHLPV